MSLALPAQPPRRLGGPALGGPPSATGGNGAPPTAAAQPEFLLDTLAGVEGGPVAMGAEEEASSVEAVASPPPVPPAPAPTKSSHRSGSHHHHHHHHHGYANCFGLPYQVGGPPVLPGQVLGFSGEQGAVLWASTCETILKLCWAIQAVRQPHPLAVAWWTGTRFRVQYQLGQTFCWLNLSR